MAENEDRPLTKHDLELLGVDPDDHDEMREFRKDMEWARTQRKRCSTVIGKVITYVALGTAAGLGALVWSGLQTKIGIHNHGH